MPLNRLPLLGLLCLVAPALAGDVTLRLDFYYGGIKAAETTEILTLSDDGKTYAIKSHAEAVGLAKLFHGDVHMQSAGVVDSDAGLLMTLYHQKRGKRDAQTATRPQREDGVQLQRGDETRMETPGAPLFDYLTAAYRSHILGKPAAGEMFVTNGWRLKKYLYTAGEIETVDTGMGKLEAVPLIRESDRGVRKVWLAPSLDYLPVRFYIDDKGHKFETIIKSVDRGEAAQS